MRVSRFWRVSRFAWFWIVVFTSLILCGVAGAQDVFISEVLASNSSGLFDEDGDTPDWIEICSDSSEAIDLAGYFLTDDSNDLERWPFPAVTLEPGACLVVFASGKDRRDAEGELHTNFRVDDRGEFLALVAPDGRTILSAPAFPAQRSDISFGRLGNATLVRELVSPRSDARVLVATEAIHPAWHDPLFVDSSWSSTRAGVGYDVDTRGPFVGAFETDLSERLRGQSAAALVRVPFFVDDPPDVEALTLWMRCDDAFVAYLNGAEVARENIAGTPDYDDVATMNRTDLLAVRGFLEIDLDDRRDLLRAGRNVLAIHGINSAASADRFLLVPSLEARVAATDHDYGFFTSPTPGAPNGSGLASRVRDTRFSVDRGFYDASFDVVITSDTPDATIRYTLDGSEPTPTRGSVYNGPIRINSRSVLRALAYRPGFLETNIDTQSYFRSVNAAIRSLDVVSIVGDPVSVFSTDGGLYEDPLLRGMEAEREVSVEFLDPAIGVGVQRDAGIRLHGSSYRRRTIGRNPNAKWSFRIYARNRYDSDDEFSYPLIDTSPIERHSVLHLRGGYNDSSNPFIRDELGRRLFGDMGNVVSLGSVVHLFINGRLKNNGYYNPAERYGEHLFREKFGSDEDWDVVTKWQASGTPADPPRDFASPYYFDVRDGDQHSFEGLLDFASLRDLTNAANYAEIARRLDLDAFIDYLIIQGYTRIRDWPHNNWVAGRERSDGRFGAWRFYPWDLEFGWRSADLTDSFKTPGGSNSVPLDVLYSALRRNPEFRVRFGDRAQKHFFAGGALHRDNVVRRFEELRAMMSLALPNMSTFIRDTWAGGRPPNVISSMTSLGLFTSEGPRFTVDGEAIGQLAEISDASSVTIRNPPVSPGTVYYTLDGTDPRLEGGALRPRASIASVGAVATRVLIGETADLRYLVPQSADATLGLTWTDRSFDDSAWTEGRSGVGYERSVGYEDLIESDVESSMFEINGSAYLRLRFQVDDPSSLASLVLRMRYDDGFRAYLNGTAIASRNSPAWPAWNSTATSGHPDAAALVAEEISLPEAVGLLVAGENVLAIHGMNTSTGSSDFLIVPELSAVESDGVEDVNEITSITRSTLVSSRSLDGGDWSARSDAFLVVDSSALRITEICYHPRSAASGSISNDDEDYEFLELQNVGPRPLNLSRMSLAGGIRFTFPDRPDPAGDLLPGEFVLVVRDREAFEERYDATERGLRIAGEYDGSLDNAGERLVLEDALGRTILDFTYSDDWFPLTDGQGLTLERVDPAGEPIDFDEWSSRAGWAPSLQLDGSPGESSFSGGGHQQVGDLNQDGRFDVSDPVALLRHLFLGERPVLPCGDGTIEDAANLALLDTNGDGEVDVTDSIAALAYLFSNGPALRMGGGCAPIDGCESRCLR